MYISELMTGAPTNERCPLERRMYETLDKLKIPYERVDNDPAASMEECAEVDKVLGTEIRKNVFLCMINHKVIFDYLFKSSYMPV